MTSPSTTASGSRRSSAPAPSSTRTARWRSRPARTRTSPPVTTSSGQEQLSASSSLPILPHPARSTTSHLPACLPIPSSAARTSRAPASRTRRRTTPAAPIHSVAIGSSAGDCEQRRRAAHAGNDDRNRDRIQQDRQHHVPRPRRAPAWPQTASRRRQSRSSRSRAAPTSSSGWAKSGAWNRNATSGTSSTSVASSSTTMPSSLPT